MLGAARLFVLFISLFYVASSNYYVHHLDRNTRQGVVLLHAEL